MMVTSRAAVHKATAAVRGMNSEEFSSLMDSMRTAGQVLPILTHRGEIVDGRERLKACQRLKIEPIIQKVDPDKDPLDVIYAANVCRKHLDVSERAAAASLLNKRSPEDLAALGISKRSVEHADHVYRKGSPATIQALESRKVSVSLASQISKLEKPHQDKLIEKINSGEKSEVIAELKSLTPTRKQAVDERPAVSYPEELQPTAAEVFESVKLCPDPMEVARLMITELFKDYQLEIMRTFLPAIETPPINRFEQDNYETKMSAILDSDEDDEEPADVTPDNDPEILDLETIEIVRDRISDEMIESPAMVGLGGRIGSLATAVGAVRLLFAATEKYAPKGDVGKLSDPAIATACGFSGQADGFVSAMVQEGFLQRDIEHRLLVTDWPDLCPRDLAEELCGTGVGYAEPTGIPKFKEPKQRKVKNEPVPIYSDAFLDFWNAYPPRGRAGKDKAWKSWQESTKRATPPEGQAVEAWLIQRAKDFAQSEKGKSEYVPATEVWLNQGRWDDAPEAWTRGSKKEAEKADWTKELRQAPKSLFAKT